MQAVDRLMSILLNLTLSQSKLNGMLMPDVGERYCPVVTRTTQLALNKHEGVWCLDVGGGPGGIARFLDKTDASRTVICDLNWDALKKAQAAGTGIPVMGDATQLPFVDNAMPAVVCVHALEHIPEGIARSATLAEMLRVTSDAIVIEGPFGTHAEDLSILFIGTLQRMGRPINPVALEHLTCGLPQVDRVLNTLEGNEHQVAMRRNFRVEYVAALVSHLPVLRYLSGFLWRHLLVRWNNQPPFVEAFISYRKTQ